jgi:RNA-directed DNA polymerase
VTPGGEGTSGRSGKAKSHTPDVHVTGKSDDCVVPMKPANEAAAAVEESVEGRRSIKGNVTERAAPRTQSRKRVSTGLCGVRDVARRDKRVCFTALLHHVTVDRLQEGFFALLVWVSPRT